MEEVAELRATIARLIAEKERLEEELDLLAEDNERLREQLSKYQREIPNKPEVTENEITNGESLPPPPSVPDHQPLDVFIDSGEENYVKHPIKQILNAAGGKNVICTAFLSMPSSEDGEKGGDLLLSGGVDGCLRGFDPLTGVELISSRLPSPLLCIAVSGSLIAGGGMDGSLLLVLLSSSAHSPFSVSREKVMKEHSKPLVALSWGSEGRILATAGHDKTIHLYNHR